MRVILHAKTQIVDDIPNFRRTEEGISDGDLTGEQMGRLSYNSWEKKSPKTRENKGYLLNIENQHHYSVLAHATVTFYIDGVTRNLTHELIRHRWISITESSQRYIDQTQWDMAQHPGLDDHSFESIKYVVLRPAKSLYQLIQEKIQKNGGTLKEARQAARHALPSGMETQICITTNLRGWRDMLDQRLAEGADKEIQKLAQMIYLILSDEFPNSFQDFDIKGKITVERLIERELARFDAGLFNASDYVSKTRQIVKEGLWTLVDDPWGETYSEDSL